MGFRFGYFFFFFDFSSLAPSASAASHKHFIFSRICVRRKFATFFSMATFLKLHLTKRFCILWWSINQPRRWSGVKWEKLIDNDVIHIIVKRFHWGTKYVHIRCQRRQRRWFFTWEKRKFFSFFSGFLVLFLLEFWQFEWLFENRIASWMWLTRLISSMEKPSSLS